MTEQQIREAAIRFKPMPDDLNSAEILYFVTMRTLSADYRQKRISAETARMEGYQARRAFERNNFNLRLNQHSADLWRGIEATGTRYAKERTIEAADAFYNTVYGLKTDWNINTKEAPTNDHH